jgi:hypothetical protein
MPMGLGEQPYLTVSAVLPPPEKAVILSNPSATKYDAFVFMKFPLPNFGKAYALRFTAYGKCDEVIGLDDITVEYRTLQYCKKARSFKINQKSRNSK